MKTDRELLELAAKAYFAQEVADGVCSFWWDEKEQAIVYIHGDNQDHNGNDVELLWIPRDDDGDALRLAGKLYLVVAVMKATHDQPAFTAVYHFNGPEHVSEVHGEDKDAATRLAVLRVAAAIGEKMP